MDNLNNGLTRDFASSLDSFRLQQSTNRPTHSKAKSYDYSYIIVPLKGTPSHFVCSRRSSNPRTLCHLTCTQLPSVTPFSHSLMKKIHILTQIHHTSVLTEPLLPTHSFSSYLLHLHLRNLRSHPQDQAIQLSLSLRFGSKPASLILQSGTVSPFFKTPAWTPVLQKTLCRSY